MDTAQSNTAGDSAKATTGNSGRRETLGAADVEIAGPPGDRHLVVSLSSGSGSSETRGVLAEAGAMVWMTPGVSISTGLRGGVLKALKRVLASETAFVNAFHGAAGALALAPDFPCDILELTLAPGEALELAAGAFLASDDGVVVTGRLSLLGGLIGQTDLVGVRLENPSGAARRAWVAGNGATRMHKLASESDGLLVDNHRVLACTPGAKRGYARAGGGGRVSGIFGGEGVVQSFAGPGTVWTQTRRSLPYLIEKVARATGGGGGGGGGVAFSFDAGPSPPSPSPPNSQGGGEGGGGAQKSRPKLLKRTRGRTAK